VEKNSDIQIGVASWDISYASGVFPGAATRVSYSWDFIRKNCATKAR